MKSFRALIFPLLFFIVMGCGRSDSYDYIAELDHEISLRENYDRIKIDRINYLKSLLSQASNDEERTNIQWEIVNEYRTFQGDSAEVYAIRLIEFGENSESAKAQTLGQIGLLDSFTSMGYLKEANDVLNLIEYDEIPDEIKPFYLDLAYRLYENLENFVYDSGSGLKDIYRQKRFDYLKQLIEITRPDSYEHEAAQIEMNQLSGQPLEDIVRQREMLLKKYKTSDLNVADQYTKMADSSLDLHKNDEAREYISKSAVANLKSSVKDADATMKLAEMLKDAGDAKRASEYIHLALDDAEFYGSQLRKVKIGSILPLIENAGYNKKKSRNTFGIVMLIIAAVLLVVSGLLYFSLRDRDRQINETYDKLHKSKEKLSQRDDEVRKLHKELNEILEQLKEAIALKDEYIMQSLVVNSGFMNSIEQKAKDIARQVREKKYEELKFVENRLGIKEERQKIYKSFDVAFRKMFPNFIEEINRLLPEEDHFEVAENEDFPVDLRIFALIRLGISDPADIARYLNLSVKTVYVYKTRLKSKSLVDNTDFESRILDIPKP
ncbi:MAG: hypothetical protein J1E16_09485 [Muribaculaceae bacterium]|nr:hypothetical protein [Muribaculaceae bacterium]